VIGICSGVTEYHPSSSVCTPDRNAKRTPPLIPVLVQLGVVVRIRHTTVHDGELGPLGLYSDRVLSLGAYDGCVACGMAHFGPMEKLCPALGGSNAKVPTEGGGMCGA
jgi:hypothetical protein